jgi:twitching motility protein PilU
MQPRLGILLPSTVDNKPVAAVEVLLGTKTIQDLIYKGDINFIKDIITKPETLGMQTFDAVMFKLHQGGKVSLEKVLKNADSANNLRLRIKLAEGGVPVGSAQEAKLSDSSSQEALAFAGLLLKKTEEEKERIKSRR